MFQSFQDIINTPRDYYNNNQVQNSLSLLAAYCITFVSFMMTD